MRIEGKFNVDLLNARGFCDADFEAARREGVIKQLLSELPLEQRCPANKNRIMDNMAGYQLDFLFSMPACSDTFNLGGSAAAALAFICLLTYDSEPTYTEVWSWETSGTNMHNVTGTAATGSAAKRFEEDQITPWEIWADTSGREAVYFRNRFLYTPSEGVSSDIRSIGIYHSENGDSTGGYYISQARVGRVRLKDAGGNPIILNKTGNQVLLVEYTFALISN